MTRAVNLAAPLTALGLLLLPALLYVGAYAALVTHEDRGILYAGGCFVPNAIREVKYRFGGDAAAALFRPMHLLDRQLRPEHWRSGEAWE
jgi:hypothetical protein